MPEKRSHSEIMKEKWKDPEYVKKIKKARREQMGDPIVRKAQSDMMKEYMKDPAFKKRLLEAQIKAQARIVGKNQFALLTLLEKKGSLFVYQIRKNIPNIDIYNALNSLIKRSFVLRQKAIDPRSKQEIYKYFITSKGIDILNENKERYG